MPRQAVLFLIDTQGANCVGCYAGNPRLGTPNVDALAADGLRFDHAYTCAPVCGPARSAIFTGLYPHANGVLANDQSPHQDIPSLGQRLHAAGVHTAYIGKWHLDGSDYFGDGRCPPGWDPSYWFDGRNYLESLPDDAARDLSRRVLGPADVARHNITAEFTHAHRTVGRARAFLERHAHEDFFLVVSIDEPHHPFICPEPFASRFEDFEFAVPNANDPLVGKPRSQQEWARHSAAASHPHLVSRGGVPHFRHPRYFSCNSFSDFEVGRVLEAIDAHAPEAMVLYTADHGDMFHSHGLQGKGPVVYEEVARVPFIVRWPGHIAPGTVLTAPVSHIDIVPTLLDRFGVAVPDILHGRSLLPRLRGAGRNDRSEANEVFIEFNRFEVDHDGFGAFSPIRAVFDGRYKLAINLLDHDEFYDLREDPLELCNRVTAPGSADALAARDRLHDAILHWMNTTRDPLRGPHWRRRPWRELAGSTWGGPTRPRPFDPTNFPSTLLYDSGRPIDRYVYDKT